MASSVWRPWRFIQVSLCLVEPHIAFSGSCPPLSTKLRPLGASPTRATSWLQVA